MKVLFVGDIVGNPGRKAAKELIPNLKRELSIDFCIANCENAAGGSGITFAVAQEMYKCGIDAITMGNHTWSKKDVMNFIDSDSRIIRPANYPSELPGKGSAIINRNDLSIGLLNLMGRVYMDSLDCPFRAADRELEYLKSFVKVIITDIHAEATSEKHAMAWYLDGRVSCVIGTHTHVQTSDERILPCGTGYITDVGMTGPYNGILGVDRKIIINRFLNHIPARFEVANGDVQFSAVVMKINDKNGKTECINRIFKILRL